MAVRRVTGTTTQETQEGLVASESSGDVGLTGTAKILFDDDFPAVLSRAEVYLVLVKLREAMVAMLSGRSH